MLNNSQGATPRCSEGKHLPSAKNSNLHAAAQIASFPLIQRINHLLDNQKHEECALLVARSSSLSHCVRDLPMSRAYDAIPHSLVFLGAVYSKISLSGDSLITELCPESFLRHVVKWLSSEPRPAAHKDSSVTPYVASIRDILRIIVRASPDLPQKLNRRKQNLHRCILQLGHHGLVDSSDFKMMNLHEALKVELKKRLQQLKSALQKLEELSSCHRRGSQTPSDGSHQRMLQISLAELEERLIKNKSSLTTVEALVANSHVDYLVNILEERVDADKQMLFHLMELRREFGEENIPSHSLVAQTLKRHISGHEQVLSIWREVLPLQFADAAAEDADATLLRFSAGSSGSTGQLSVVSSHESASLSQSGQQHSISNPALNTVASAAAAAAEPPLSNGCKDARGHHPASRPLPSIPGTPEMARAQPSSRAALTNGSTVQTDQQAQVVDELRKEVKSLKQELSSCKDTISQLQHREKLLRERLSAQAQRQFEKGASKFENLNMGDNRPTALVRRYGNLYSEIRLDTFDALDDLPEIAACDDLKGKLLFSVVVLAFRSVQRSLTELRQRVRELLCLPSNPRLAEPDVVAQQRLSMPEAIETAARDVEDVISVYMKKMGDKYDVSKNVEEVCGQVWATLFDYPSLRNCQGLQTYVKECVHVAWALSVQNPPLLISYEAKTFSPTLHTRFHTSDPNCNQISSFLWPSLLEGDDGHCVYKGVVIT